MLKAKQTAAITTTKKEKQEKNSKQTNKKKKKKFHDMGISQVEKIGNQGSYVGNFKSQEGTFSIYMINVQTVEVSLYSC